MSGNLTAVVTALTSTTVAAGGAFSFAGRTSNVSNQSTGAGSTTRFFLSADAIIDPFDTVLQIQTVPTLAANNEYVQNYLVNLPGNLVPGTWYIGGLADYHNQIGETNEGDNNFNRLTITVTPPLQPDLRSVVTALTSTAISAGGSFSFSVNTVNEGSAAAAASTTRIFLSSDTNINGQDTVLQITPVGALNPGTGSTQNFQVGLPGNLAPGTYYIGGLADFHNQIGESNEGNNNGNHVTITILPPDLTETVTALSSTSVVAGGTFSFASRTSNLGQGNSPGSSSAIYISTDPNITTGDTLLQTRNVGTLASGATNAQNYVVNLPSNLAGGTYYIGGVADYLGQVTEGNEGNNNNNVIAVTVPNNAFSINFNYSGDQQYLQYFTAAATRWSQVITGDLPDVNSAQYGFVDDLLIQVNIAPIDGVGGVLGQAGPDARRSGATGLPYHGSMTFDSADVANLVANGTFGSVVLHEIGHILGIGSLWNSFGLRNGSDYIGVNGVNAYRQITGNGALTSVPLETGGGSGTALVHWSEQRFGNELMTGYLNNGANPLSILTIGGLADLGYAVNYGAADAYSALVAGPEASEGANSGVTASMLEEMARYMGVPVDSLLGDNANFRLSDAIAGNFGDATGGFADTGGCRADPSFYGPGLGEEPVVAVYKTLSGVA